MSRISKIYLDNASSTPTDPIVKATMVRAIGLYGNPSAFNDTGRQAGDKLRDCRKSIAKFIGARSEEVIFTSSGSESNNLALFGSTTNHKKSGEIITTFIEHSSVLEPLKILSKRGWKIKYLKVNREGIIDLDDLNKKLNSRVVLVSVMYANNEIGSIEPIKKISKVINEFNTINKIKILFHTDACQATEYLDMNVNNLGVDLMTFNGSKIYGPKGIAVLYKKRGVSLEPLIYGGGQENSLRAGTENVVAVAGLEKAVTLISKKEVQRVSELRDYFLEKLKKSDLDLKINGPLGYSRLPNNINISISDLDSDKILLELDKYGISASSGSACTARSVEPSHVLRAIDLDKKYINGTIRFSLGRQTTKKDINYVLKVLPEIISELKLRYKK